MSSVDSTLSVTAASTFLLSTTLVVGLVLVLGGVRGMVPGTVGLVKASDLRWIGDGDLCIDHLTVKLSNYFSQTKSNLGRVADLLGILGLWAVVTFVRDSFLDSVTFLWP